MMARESVITTRQNPVAALDCLRTVSYADQAGVVLGMSLRCDVVPLPHSEARPVAVEGECMRSLYAFKEATVFDPTQRRVGRVCVGSGLMYYEG